MKTSWYRASGIIVLFFLFVMTAAAMAAPMTVTVEKVVGKVELLSPADWKTLSVGDKVPVGAEVRTGAGASCMLKWAGGNVARLQPMTVLKVEEADRSESGGERTTLDLKEGKIFAHAKKLANKNSRFDLKTPTAVAGVRGTDFFGEVSGGASNFAVGEGSLHIEAGGETLVLDEGLFVSVDESGAISEPAPIPPEIIVETKEKFDEVKNEGKQDEAKVIKEEKPEEKKEEKKAGEEEKKKEELKEEKKEEPKDEKAEKDEVKDEKEAGKEPDEKPGGDVAGGTKEPDAPEADAGTEVEAEAGIEAGAGEAPEVAVEPEIAVNVDDMIATVTDQVMDNQTTIDVITAAQELIESGTVHIIVNVESQ